MTVLITGGAGYIGSHTCAELLGMNREVIAVDNFCNSSAAAIEKINKITGKKLTFYEADLRDEAAMDKIFSAHKIDAVIHFAALKAVGVSVAEPITYYDNNINSTLTLCKTMKKHNVNSVIFSSSASTYDGNSPMPLTEDSPQKAINPYAWSKIMCERILRDACFADKSLSVVALRYFNVVGAHPSGLIGDTPSGIPNNIMPFIAQTAKGLHKELKVFGNDYPTPDGTCTRDYIHVMDLVRGHIMSIDYAAENSGFEVFNLGRGEGISVLEVIQTFERVNGLKLPYSIGDRRPGDNPESYAGTAKAAEMLGFRAEKTLEDMCRDMWNYQKGSCN